MVALSPSTTSSGPGRVLDGEDDTVDTKAIRALNEQLAQDDRIECVMLTVRDGLTLVRRRDSR